MDDKKQQSNSDEVRDFKDGLKGNDQQSIFSDRSDANAEGLKEKAKLDEAEKRDDEKKEDEDDSGDDD